MDVRVLEEQVYGWMYGYIGRWIDDGWMTDG